MEYLTTKKTRKINAIVCMKLFGILPIEVVIQHFERFIKEIVPEVQSYKSSKKNESPKTKSPNLGNFSHRKKAIRKTQMYKDVDLRLLFKQSVQEFEAKVNEKGLKIMDFERKDIETRFLALLNN